MNIFEKLLVDLLKHEVHNFKSWLFTYSRNFCLMQLRKKKIEVSISDNENDQTKTYANELVEYQEDLHPIDEKEIKLQQLEKAVEELNEEQKRCIKLFYLEEKSYQQVVDETGFEMKKVKSYIQNGKRNLMLLLTKNKVSIFLILIVLNG